VTKVVKSHEGRLRMRRVSRINQAMNLCLGALWTENAGAAAGDGPPLAAITVADVRRVAAAYLANADLITAVAR